MCSRVEWRFVDPGSHAELRVTHSPAMSVLPTLGPAYNEFGYNQLIFFLVEKFLPLTSKFGCNEYRLQRTNFRQCKMGPAYNEFG